MRRPRILLLVDRPGWAFDVTAQAIVRHLGALFDFEILYVSEKPRFQEESYDLIYVYWWGERYHRLMVSDYRKVVKEISSHRWEVEPDYGMHAPCEALERYMHDASALVTTSFRLKRAFEGIFPHVYHFPRGVDPDLLRPLGRRSGHMTLGWAGNIKDPIKGVRDILEPAWGQEFDTILPEGYVPRREMGRFYNSMDVFCVTSLAEGEPLTLIEAMACGCFPVCCDVGIVPELIYAEKQNGLIVERTPEAFRDAFRWCRENLDLVRRKGLENAQFILDTRSWEKVTPIFASILNDCLTRMPAAARARPTSRCDEPSLESRSSAEHGRLLKPSEDDYPNHRQMYREHMEVLLPTDKQANILGLGTGLAHLSRYLLELHYMRVSGVHPNGDLTDLIRQTLGNRLERIKQEAPVDFLRCVPGRYDCVIAIDMLEHMTRAQGVDLLRLAYYALRPGGRLILTGTRPVAFVERAMESVGLVGPRVRVNASKTTLKLFASAGVSNYQLHVPEGSSMSWRGVRYHFDSLKGAIRLYLTQRDGFDSSEKRWVVWASR